MDSIESVSVSPLPNGRITTDAIQRRFVKKDSNKSNDNRSKEDNDYFCTECNRKLQDGEEELKSHFEEVQHKSHSVCGSCSKPIYSYVKEKNTKLYHVCKYLKNMVFPK